MHRYPRKIIKKLLASSLKASSHERKEEELKGKLAQIVPDLSKQYSHFTLSMDDEYFVEKIRSQHAFQVSIAMKAINLIKDKKISILLILVTRQEPIYSI
jgi:hypothetical protein